MGRLRFESSWRTPAAVGSIVLVRWRLDRLGRNVRHSILLLDKLQAIGIGFVTLGEGMAPTSPTGRLVLHVLGAIAEFERERIRERVVSGSRRARAQGRRLARPRVRVPLERLQAVARLPADDAARTLASPARR